MSIISVMAEGFALGTSLIVAIGAQNAFVLQQGLRRQHVLAVILFCALSDSLLILLGVYGFGGIVRQYPFFVTLMTYGGALFLTIYGLLAWRRAYNGTGSLAASDTAIPQLSTILLTLFGFTFLNPHVYLDTVVLIGSLSLKYDAALRPAFAAGAMLGSWLWFASLGYGARLLIPIFRKPVAWRLLDGFIGLVMLALAISLLTS